MPSLSDLRNLFYGGGSASEYDFLTQAAASGITATTLLAGREIPGCYAEILVDTTAVSGGSIIDLPGCSIVVPAQPTVWWIFWGGEVYSAVVNGLAWARVQEGAATIDSEVFNSAAANAAMTASRVRRMAPFSGADRTFRLTIQSLVAANTAHAVGDPSFPFSIGAVR